MKNLILKIKNTNRFEWISINIEYNIFYSVFSVYCFKWLMIQFYYKLTQRFYQIFANGDGESFVTIFWHHIYINRAKFGLRID